MGFTPPNYTQTPNEIFDELLKTLGFAELKVLMVIIRKTFGWHKVRDRISLTQLENHTGLKRDHIIRASRSLASKKHITRYVEGTLGNQSTYYELVIDEDSNNSYRVSNSLGEVPLGDGGESLCETGGSPFKGPTKETPTKETNQNRKEEGAPEPLSPPPLPNPVFSYKRLKIPPQRYENLISEFGEAKVKEMMDRLDEYADINPKRFKAYGCHGAVIGKWLRDEGKLPQKAYKSHSIVDIQSTPSMQYESNKKLAKEMEIKFSQDKAKEVWVQTWHDRVIVGAKGKEPTAISYSENGFNEQLQGAIRKMTDIKINFVNV